MCRAVFTVLPHFILRYRQMHPEVARNALLATHGGLSLELCAVIGHISPMALYRLICAFGHHSLVKMLTRCGLPLPPSYLADEKHSHWRVGTQGMTRSTRWAAVCAMRRPAQDGQKLRRLQLKASSSFCRQVLQPSRRNHARGRHTASME
jgi:hypothetical protein